jgi:hypothetical protein
METANAACEHEAKGDEDVYQTLSHHQRHEDWFGHDIAAALQEWAERFDEQFKLNIPEMALRVDALSRSCYGHFRYGHNGFGLRGEIAINSRYLRGQRQQWEVLGTLLHEMLHAWQQAHGEPGKGNYHNHEFRNKALMYGLVIDRRGRTRYLDDSPFVRLLKQYRVDVPPLPSAAAGEKRERGESKMKKWSCRCTNLRCAKELNAVCRNCGQEFNRCP